MRVKRPDTAPTRKQRRHRRKERMKAYDNPETAQAPKRVLASMLATRACEPARQRARPVAIRSLALGERGHGAAQLGQAGARRPPRRTDAPVAEVRPATERARGVDRTAMVGAEERTAALVAEHRQRARGSSLAARRECLLHE